MPDPLTPERLAEIDEVLGYFSNMIERLAAAGTEMQDLRDEVERLRAEVQKWRRIRTPTHGTCCTCQACGEHHDDCRCDLDELVDRAVVAETEVVRLKARLAAAEKVCKAGEVFKQLPRRFGAKRLQASMTLGMRLKEWRQTREVDEAKEKRNA